VVHNLRSALDHLFWQLYLRYIGVPKPGWETNSVQFPIESGGKGFAKKRKRFRKIPHREWAIIEGAQPYKRRNRKRTLGLLRELSNRDKHQILTPILTRPAILTIKGGAFEGTGALKWAQMLPPKRKNLKVNTKLMRVKNLPTDRGLKVEVAGYITPHVMLPERRDITIVAAIDDMIACVEGVINDFM